MYLVNVNGIKIRKNEVASYTRGSISASRGISKIKEEFTTRKGELCIQVTIHKGGKLLGIGACKLNAKTPLNNTILLNAEKLAESRALERKEEIQYRLRCLSKIENNIFSIKGIEVHDKDIVVYDGIFYVYRKSFSSDTFTLYKLTLDNYRDNHLKIDFYNSVEVTNETKDDLIYTGKSMQTVDPYMGLTMLAINRNK